MKPFQIDLPDIYRGCDWPPVVLEWKDNDGQPFDLTGWQPYAFTTRFNLNATVINPASGLAVIIKPKEETSILRLGVDRWDWVWTGNGKTYPPALTGTVLVKDKKAVV